MKKITPAFVIGIVLILILIIITFIYYATATNKIKPEIQNPIKNMENKTQITEIVIEPEHLSYLLNEMGTYKLHNPPMSSNTPKINLRVDEQEFKAEVENTYTKVEKGSWENPDIKIVTERSEVIEAITSTKIQEYMKTSVASGKTSIELVAGYTELFSKGYLALYQDLTGKSFTGSVIRIFAQG